MPLPHLLGDVDSLIPKLKHTVSSAETLIRLVRRLCVSADDDALVVPTETASSALHDEATCLWYACHHIGGEIASPSIVAAVDFLFRICSEPVDRSRVDSFKVSNRVIELAKHDGLFGYKVVDVPLDYRVGRRFRQSVLDSAERHVDEVRDELQSLEAFKAECDGTVHRNSPIDNDGALLTQGHTKEPSPPKAPRKRRKRAPRTEPTAREAEAWAAYQRTGNYRATARALGIRSHSAAYELVKKAETLMNKKGRSVRTQSIPTDTRGQETVAGD